MAMAFAARPSNRAEKRCSEVRPGVTVCRSGLLARVAGKSSQRMAAQCLNGEAAMMKTMRIT